MSQSSELQAPAVEAAHFSICRISDRKIHKSFKNNNPEIIHESANIAIYEHGIEVKSEQFHGLKCRAGGGIRGKVEGFSNASRRKMLWVCRCLKMGAFNAFIFVTLTYHDNWTDRDYKKDRERYLKRIRRLYPDVAFLWRLEPQKRGAPHFHILFLLPNADQSMCVHFEAHWHQLVDKGNVHHKKYGAKVIWLDSGYKGVSLYISKYSAKMDICSAPIKLQGRQWGKSKNLPLDAHQEIKLTSKEEAQVRRVARGLLRSRQNTSCKRYASTVVEGHTSKVFMDGAKGADDMLRYVLYLKNL